MSVPTSCWIGPRPKTTCFSDAIQRVFGCFWPPATEHVHTDHVDADSPPDPYLTQNLVYTAYFWNIHEKVNRRFGWSVTDRVHSVHVGAASPPDQYPTQNLDYLGQILSKFL
ncbi:hypothetical protein B0H14DRAFT_3509689 [Mycena olivaceomarginata]|nr:hypothetical protein B0H14DRAFT_3509689 [Mycena olivaceomarginata]